MHVLGRAFMEVALPLVLFATLPAFGLAQVNPETGSSRDLIGYTALAAELGSEISDGSGTVVAMVEAFNGGGSAYLPNAPSKIINDRGLPQEGQTSTTSGHASGSGNIFFGGASTSQGTDNIDAYSAGFWLGGGGLNFGGNSAPLTQSYHVSNHSYVVNGNSDFGTSEATDLLQRLDYYVDQNDSLVVAGSSNGNSTNLPLLLAPSFNALSVGRSSGGHGAGPTTFYFAGRTKVDIVAPEVSTSSATPRVASVASFLVDAAGGDPDAIHVETLKATLLAGATKEEFPSWDRTTTRPIDERFGAGEVNAYHSYKIQAGGQFEGSSALGGSLVGDLGWDYSDSLESTQSVPERYYRFEVGNDQYLNELSIVLSWNIDIIDDNSGFNRFSFTPEPNLVNLDLELLDTNGNVVDASLSTVDNVEHIYIKDLAPGTYDLKLSGDADSDFALAWRLNGSALPGDFDLDRDVDADDIDQFSGNLGQMAQSELVKLDLDLDGMITQSDHDLHVTSLVQNNAGGFGTSIGDISLNGVTDVLGDALILISNLGRRDSVSYSDGDLNADGAIDVFGDALTLISHLGSRAGD